MIKLIKQLRSTFIFSLKALSLGLYLTLGLSALAQATLIGRLPATLGGTDYQAVYDTDLDITWLADTNLIASNSFGLLYNTELDDYPSTSYVETDNRIFNDGRANWGGASHWVDAMNASSGGTGYLGYDDWRLAKEIGPFDNELSHLFYDELGGRPPAIATSAPNNGGPDLVLFNNLQTSNYWTGIEFSNPEFARFFRVAGTQSDAGRKTDAMFVIAARDGDIAAVPVPAAMWLMGSALMGLVGFKRKKTV